MLNTLKTLSNSFIYMTPFEGPFYFIVLILALIPLMISLYRGKRSLVYQNIITVFFLWTSFAGPNWTQGVSLLIYLLWQSLLVYFYFNYRQVKNKNSIFYLAVFLAILPMLVIKLSPIFVPQLSTFRFLGYSYLTFKAVQMIMEVRDGLIKEYHPGRYLQFLVFFPTISSGPIDRYRRFEKELLHPPTKEKYLDLLDKGIWRIFLGLAYKFIIGYILAEHLIPVVKQLALTEGGLSLGLLAYMYTYSFQLFFDFAGYSLLAVGTSNLMGYETPMNFDKPFLSHNIKEFWNRWHISLSFWFRDYVYMRLMFTLIKKKVFKSRIVASNVGYFALFIIMGLWHGLTWYYLVYGLFHATLICLTDAWLRFKKKHQEKIPSNRWTKGFSIFLTFNTVCFSLLISSGFLEEIIKNMLTFG